jgi:predicted dehydrogenase
MRSCLRLGMLGTGLAAKLLYLPALKSLERKIQVVACANRTRKKAEQFARLLGGAKVVDTAEELIARPDVQALLISLPIDSQPEYVRMALRAGKAVLSEKPVAPSVAAGKRLLKAVSQCQSPWLVGENYHFMPHVEKLQQWVSSGRLGDLRVVEAVQINKMDHKNPYFHTRWRREPNFVGGFVVDGGVHVAHILGQCVGRPLRVVSRTRRFDPTLGPMDSAVALLEFPDSVLGTWTSCFAGHYRGPVLRLSGSHGYAELDYSRVILVDRAGKTTVFESKADSFAAQFSHFADVVLHGATPRVTPQEALADLALLETITRGK